MPGFAPAATGAEIRRVPMSLLLVALAGAVGAALRYVSAETVIGGGLLASNFL